MTRLLACLAALVLGSAAAAQPSGAGGTADLAKQLSNPVASLISVPFQFNYNAGFPGGDGDQFYLNVQPVIPISISRDWNLISRTILPIYDQDISDARGRQVGLGPTTQSFFLSPKAPTAGGLIWGVGPVVLVPTDTDGLGTHQWGAGVTGVGLKQSGPWTFGALANHIWSITRNDEEGDISSTFLQPFLSYTTPRATSFTLNTESTYDWEAEQWSVPINAVLGQVVHVGKRPVQLSVGARYWAEAPDTGPEGWGARFVVTLLFPK